MPPAVVAASSRCRPRCGPAVVLLGAAAHLAGPGGATRRAGENLQVVRDVALVAAQRRGELADGRFILAEGEQQPVAHGMGQRLELFRGGDRRDIRLPPDSTSKEFVIVLDALSSVWFS